MGSSPGIHRFIPAGTAPQGPTITAGDAPGADRQPDEGGMVGGGIVDTRTVDDEARPVAVEYPAHGTLLDGGKAQHGKAHKGGVKLSAAEKKVGEVARHAQKIDKGCYAQKL